MRQTPIQINLELVANCGRQENQFGTFEKAVKKVVTINPATFLPCREKKQ